jgi:uroporphyrinogen-III synthase
MRILVTRPLPDGERTAETLRRAGHDVVMAPLMRVDALAPAIPDKSYAAVLVTSANAPRALAKHPERTRLLGLPVLTVGRASAEAARAAGFAEVLSADGDAADLVALVAAERNRGALKSGPLLYLAGEDRATDLAAALAGHGLTADTVVVYRAAEAGFPGSVAQALRDDAIDAVLHFSKRSAALYVDGATAAGVRPQALAPKHFCFAPQTGELLREAGASQVFVAPKPQEQALLSLIG